MTMPGPTEPPLTLCLFGPFEAHVNGAPLPRLRSRKGLWLLALLALRHGREVERDWLAGTLWPDGTPAQVSHNLSMSLTDLRHALGPEADRLRSPARRTLGLDLAGAAVDVLAFDTAIARGDAASLERAAALYRGPLLEGCTEEWAFQERQAREQAYLTARETLAAHALAREDPAEAERHLRFVVAADPLRESAQRALMEVLAAGGSYAAALLAYRELRLRLHRELNAEPDPETQTLFQRLRAEARDKAAGSHPAGEAGYSSPSRTPAAGDGRDPHARSTSAERSSVLLFPHNLPLQLTSFVGRQAEMAELRQQLAAHRLVTLTGAGGCGKTRLALEAASGLPAAYPGGTWLVALAPLADPALVPQTVAAALSIREQPDCPLVQTLVEALTPKQLLLVLDNCEHLVAACAELAETLLQACPHLRILATSREPLGIAGEWAYRVPSLSLPPASGVGGWGLGIESGSLFPSAQPPIPNALLQYEAVRLFVERAATAQPAFVLTAESAAIVAQVCCRLDGIPLALELAAARLKALPLETLNERLDDMFGLVTGGQRTALPRHRTLRALIDWSYDLLTPPEQGLLRRLSVFAGGCSLDAAEAVCSDFGFWILDFGLPTPEARETVSPAPGRVLEAELPASSDPIQNPKSKIQNDEVLDLLTRLVEKSLVLYEERAGEGRYRLLEMIREYAREQLAATGEADALRERHARFSLALGETAERELTHADPVLWLDRLEWEHDNLRAALAWSVESDDLDLGLRLGVALEEFWYRRGYLKEGLDQLLRLLAQPGAAAPTVTRARALSSAGRFAALQCDLETSRRLHEESLAIGRALADRAGIATALLQLGGLAMHLWDVTTALPLIEEGLAIRRELGDPRAIAGALALLAWVRRLQRDLPAERALAEESLAIWRALADRVRINSALGSLAQVISLQGDQDTARPLLEEALAVARELDDKVGIAWGITHLGYVAHWQEDYRAAHALFEQSLPLWRELDHKDGLLQSLFHLGYALQQQGDYAAACAHFEEMLAISRDWSNSPCIAASLALLGDAAADLGRWEEASVRCAESLTLCRPGERGNPHHIAWALTGMARVALARARPARAARLLGAAPALLAATNAPRWPNQRADFDRIVAATRAELGDAEFAAAWDEGQAMPIEQVITEALEEAPAG